MKLDPSAYGDDFARRNLPPAELWPTETVREELAIDAAATKRRRAEIRAAAR